MSKAHNVRRWIEALRSGRYKQGRFSLRNRNDEFCCLGVACDLLDNNKWEGCLWDSENYSMPKWAAKEFTITDFTETLISMNDERMKSFMKIADYIEANILPKAIEEDTCSVNMVQAAGDAPNPCGL